MIALIAGTVVATGSDYAIIDTIGIGYLVYLPKPALSAVNDGDTVRFFTSLIVREDSLTLYGFVNWAQRLLFDQLLAVSGIGPKVAMSLLSSLSPDDLKTALASGDVVRLSKVPGIGRKTAERMVLELKGKIDPRGLLAGAAPSSRDSELIDVLTGLGYSAAEANAAVARIPADAPDSIDDRIRLALRYFGGL